MNTRTIEIEGQQITLTAFVHNSQFGPIWKATNNYGEPTINEKGYKTDKEALDACEAEVRRMFN